MKDYDILKNKFAQYYQLANVKTLLEWDKYVNLPPKSNTTFVDNVYAIERAQNTLLKQKIISSLIEESKNQLTDQSQLRNIALMERILEELSLYPQELNKELIKSKIECEFLWRKAKKEGDFKIVRDSLDTLIVLTREKASIRASWLKKTDYEALIDIFDPGQKLSEIKLHFQKVGKALLEIIAQSSIDEANGMHLIDAKCHISNENFHGLAKKVSEYMGFNLAEGRIDKSSHPICWGYKGDVRITSSYNQNNPLTSLYAIIHEAGHGIYLQNLNEDNKYQPIGQFAGYSTHEAIALLYEAFIGRSDSFLINLKNELGDFINLSEVEFIKLVRKPYFSPIRIDSEPFIYMLHIIMRLELEEKLFLNEIQTGDIPEAWNEHYFKYFNKKITNDRDGCLQDMHWYIGCFGYFPAYGMGMLFAAQLYNRIQSLFGDALDDREYFYKVKTWLTNNLFFHGSRYNFAELVNKSTGEDLDSSHYINLMKTSGYAR